MAKLKSMFGFACPDCKKAMFFLEEKPKPNSPIEFSKMLVKTGAKRPSKELGYECQWCGARWVKMFLQTRFIGEFSIETGERIVWQK